MLRLTELLLLLVYAIHNLNTVAEEISDWYQLMC